MKYLLFIALISTITNTFTKDSEMKQNNKKINIVKKTPKKGIDIQKVMDYPIPHILDRYKKDYKVTDEIAKIHEKELKRYFIVTVENDSNTDMFSPQVDNLWHTFLLFTRDYDTFCKELFGHFIHHEPRLTPSKPASERL